MRRLTTADGTDKHLDTAQYHSRRCRQRKSDPFFSGLESKIVVVFTSLRNLARAGDDLQEALTDSRADLDEVELTFEDLVRDIDSEAARLDRQDPSLQAQKKIFPEGFGAVIRPEGKSQPAVIPDLKVRLKAFLSMGALGDYIKKLLESEAAFQAAVQDVEKAEQRLANNRSEEREAKRELREQLEENHSEIKKLYKAKPALADRFFSKDARASRSSKDVEAEGRLAGKREAIVAIFEARKLSLSEEQNKTLAALTDEDTLTRWISIAVTATPDELFTPKA